ncbi:hypothetical protein [Paraburkholderia lacunae]|uniref:Uncharacterized protein n=1 Tax=Paraburkholderia lacunae TaxID=2211104 RepID=A0A370N5B0_9BURK|nr:hypothetical protein [Paraburkholderia lacunae]RDK00786.1 hypothetical protein DLM46_20770 [Paraburkholderia lacunae]
MNEIVDLLDEYEAILDKDSLYARVLMSFIVEREVRVRHDLERRIEATTIDRKQFARLRHFARTAPLGCLAKLYEENRSGSDEIR